MVTISLLIPVYHEKENLAKVLPLYAKYFDEVVVVHDGPCTDGGLELATALSDKVKVHETSVRKGGATFIRPFGLKQVSGDWVVVADADERLPEVLLQNMHSIATERGRLGNDVILLRRITYETRKGKVTRQVADQNLPRFFRTDAGITWPIVPHTEAQGWSKASNYLLRGGLHKKYAVLHYNRAEDFPEKMERYRRIARELWPSLQGTEWEDHMRDNVFPMLGIEVPAEGGEPNDEEGNAEA